jgi:hypothetical protein
MSVRKLQSARSYAKPLDLTVIGHRRCYMDASYLSLVILCNKRNNTKNTHNGKVRWPSPTIVCQSIVRRRNRGTFTPFKLCNFKLFWTFSCELKLRKTFRLLFVTLNKFNLLLVRNIFDNFESVDDFNMISQG